MALQSFKRMEIKYYIDQDTKDQIESVLLNHMELDPYNQNGETYLIQNIYYDTPNNDLISYSISKPLFKQKVRIRKYSNMNTVFIEIKKKHNGVVGKRRLITTIKEADDFLLRGIKPLRESYVDQQVIAELDYILKYYHLKPNVFISYRRRAYFDKDNPELRVSFDEEILTRRDNLVFDNVYGSSLTESGTYLMEVKASANYPFWLTKLLSSLKVYPCSFSKYGTEYKKFIIQGGN